MLSHDMSLLRVAVKLIRHDLPALIKMKTIRAVPVAVCVFRTMSPRFVLYVLGEVAIFTERDQVVRVQRDLHVPDVLRAQVYDVMYFLRRSAAVLTCVSVSHQNVLSNLLPFFALVKCGTKISCHIN